MSGSGSANPFAYDVVPYPTAITPALTPERIRSACLIQGYRAPSIPDASMLEIGCGEGFNLMGIAAVEPGMRCVGFDLAADAIARGNEIVAATGLQNVELHAGNILDYPRDGEKFDYIVAHGIYTWIPEGVRAPLLELMAARLAPGGVAYVSLDCLPAAAAKVELNRFFIGATRHIPDPDGQIAETARLIGMLCSNQREDSRLKAQLDQIAAELPTYDPHYFFHDFMAEFYKPVGMDEFGRAAAAQGLRVIGNVDLTDYFIENLSDAAKEAIIATGRDFSKRVHLLDFLRGSQMFRRLLLVREDAPPPDEPDGIRKVSFDFLCDRERGSDEKGDYVRFSRGDDTYMFARSKAEIDVMNALHAAAPEEVSFDDLARRVDVPPEEIELILRKVLSIGLALPRNPPQPFVTTPGERPLVNKFIRTMMAIGDWTITMRHVKFLCLAEPTRYFITLCDGSRTRAELAVEMANRFGPEIGIRQVEGAIAELVQRRVFMA